MPTSTSETPPPAFKLTFEVQICSLFDFAWAKTTHALTYKSNLVDWKRYRLSAHLKAAAEQLDFLLLGFEHAAEFVPNGDWPEIEDKKKIINFFSQQVTEGRLPGEVIPKDWSRFADNFYRALQVWSDEPGRLTEPLAILDSALEIVEAELSKKKLNEIPRSLSLLQYVQAVIARSGRFSGSRKGYFSLRTDELTDLFPGVDLPGTNFGLPRS